MKTRTLVIVAVLDIALIFAFVMMVRADAMVQEVQPVTTEQNCQYPDRYYEDGSCNNSDPCDPETIKDPVLKGDCRDILPTEPEPVQTPIVEATPIVSQCGK